MRFSLLSKLFLVLALVLLSIFFAGKPVLAVAECATHGDPCTATFGDKGYEDLEKCKSGCCCPGNVCRVVGKDKATGEDIKECRGGLFTMGLSAKCLAEGMCGQCDVLKIIENAFNFLLRIAAGLAVLSLVIAGFMYIAGGMGGIAEKRAAPAMILQAKATITFVIIGLFIVVGAWLLVNIIMGMLAYQAPEQYHVGAYWWQVKCK